MCDDSFVAFCLYVLELNVQCVQLSRLKIHTKGPKGVRLKVPPQFVGMYNVVSVALCML